MDVAMEAAYNLMLQARSGVPKIVVTLTGGNDDIAAKPLQSARQKFRDYDIRSYVIGFGSQLNLDLLSNAVDIPTNLLYFPDSRSLRPKGPEATRHIAMSKYLKHF